jgi:hypothetical protein
MTDAFGYTHENQVYIVYFDRKHWFIMSVTDQETIKIAKNNEGRGNIPSRNWIPVTPDGKKGIQGLLDTLSIYS